MRETENPQTVGEALKWGADSLAAGHIESARLTAELLLAGVLLCRRVDLHTHFDRPVVPAKFNQFEAFVARRLAREPLQYILGSAEFMGFEFVVDRRVLIPRPETEVLVEHALGTLRGIGGPCSVLDIGTGSGNIAVSLAAFVPHATITGIDASGDALKVAQVNVERHGVGNRVALLHKSVFDPLENLPGGPFDVIVSNPPYISGAAARDLPPEVAQYEPAVAVFENEDGLRYFRRIAEIGPRLLQGRGWVLVEVAYDQAPEVRAIFSDSGYGNVAALGDYSGHLRVVKAQVR